jgi:ATP-dependent RNA helicase SUPV3L1/SUV3
MQNVRNVTAVLGPTNTGKTHLAVVRMLSYETGMIGLPLRLLAREIYDRVCAQAGAHTVALITGEEKIIPPEPRYYVCTVEAMPLDLNVDFLAIDEVQLAADFDRGHTFTDRILHRRGNHETMLLGSATIRGLLENLLPGIDVITRPRFSRLTYGGQKKISRLPRRSAIVAFSASTVYAIAEFVRRQRGGAAVVLGALSPRTRNAQVALYQSGDVDYLVATDAIGMGLNMDVDHVAFAATTKFDGRMSRDLNAAELGQIGGRAGRHMNDGTFGVTAEARPLTNEMVAQIEENRFAPVRVAQWRNRMLDYSSLENLHNSLNMAPQQEGLTRSLAGDDVQALEFLMADPEFRDLAQTSEAVELLWDVCQIPDYRNITEAEHALIVSQVFKHLRGDKSLIPSEWFARQLSYADRTEGDIDTLANRIAHMRTWTFLAHRTDWLEDATGWQQRAMEIENKLSDALHERLTQRFIDRRTSVLMKRLREKDELMASVSPDGDIHVEGEFIGQLHGFRFQPDESSGDAQAKTLKAASMKVIAAEFAARAKACAAAPDAEFVLKRDGNVEWLGVPVGMLGAGSVILTPALVLLANDQLTGADREAVKTRLEQFIENHVTAILEPLALLVKAEDLEGMARGLAFRLTESLGILTRDEVAEDVKSLDQPARASLRQYGVRFGAFHIFMPGLLKPAAAELKLILWALWNDKEGKTGIADLPEPPGQGLTSTVFDKSTPRGFYQAVGYRVCGSRVVRIDMLERLADVIRPRIFWKPAQDGEVRPEGSVEGGGFTVTADMMSLVGCSGEDMASILRAVGYRMDRRKIDKTPAPKGKPQAQQDDAASAASDGAEQKATPELPIVAPEAVSEPTIDAAASPASTEPDEPGEPGDEPSESEFIEVWRPAGRQKKPFRANQSTQNKDARQRAGKGNPGAGKRPPKPGQASQKARPANARPKKPEIKPEDSPFAALGALKDKLNATPEKKPNKKDASGSG